MPNYNQYNKTTWVNDNTKVNQGNMNAIEQAINDNRDNTIEINNLLAQVVTALKNKASLSFNPSTKVLTLQIGDSQTPDLNKLINTTVDLTSEAIDKVTAFLTQVATRYYIRDNIINYTQDNGGGTVYNNMLINSSGNLVADSNCITYHMIPVTKFKQFQGLTPPDTLYLSTTSDTPYPIASIAFFTSNSTLISIEELPIDTVNIPATAAYISVSLYNETKDNTRVGLTINAMEDYIHYAINPRNLEGFEFVDNTHDLDKPISTATQAALDLKIDKSSIDTSTPITANNSRVPSTKYLEDTYIKKTSDGPKLIIKEIEVKTLAVTAGSTFAGTANFSDGVIVVPLATQTTHAVRKSQLDDLQNAVTGGTITSKKAKQDESGNTIKNFYGHKIVIDKNTTTFVYTFKLLDAEDNVISTDTIDLPNESVVISGSYDSTNQKIVLTLQGGSTVDIPIGALISGLQSEITNANKLSSDLVDDTNHTHKFVTAAEKAQIATNESDITTLKQQVNNYLDYHMLYNAEDESITFVGVELVYNSETEELTIRR